MRGFAARAEYLPLSEVQPGITAEDGAKVWLVPAPQRLERMAGELLDESRHFFGMDAVKRFLELMAQHKLNVLHWHLTDNQGWRIQIDRYPELTMVASKRPYSTAHKHLLDSVPEGASGEYGPFFYTKDQIREIIDFAASSRTRSISFCTVRPATFLNLTSSPRRMRMSAAVTRRSRSCGRPPAT